MPYEKTRLTLLCEERTIVKKHMLELQNAMFKAFFVFITVAGVVAGLYWNESIFKNGDTQNILIICLTQVEVLLALFYLAMAAPINVSIGYLRSIDKQINKLCGDKKTNMWESDIAKKYIWGTSGSSLWVNIVIALFLFIIYGFFVYVGFSIVNNIYGRILIVSETIIIILLVIRTLQDLDKVEKYTDSIFDQSAI
jgi:hypothetical protein